MKTKLFLVMAMLLFGISFVPHANANVTVAREAIRYPDFAGRDKKFSYLRTRIIEGMRGGANFARYYTVIQTGCGTGCTTNLMVDRRTGKVIDIPYGGEMQQMLTLRYTVKSNLMVATWFDGDLCMLQRAIWNGQSFSIASAPVGRPDTACSG